MRCVYASNEKERERERRRWEWNISRKEEEGERTTGEYTGAEKNA